MDWFEAVKTANIPELQRWIELGVDVNFKDYHNVTPLEYAVKEGYEDMAYLLIGEGANTDELFTNGDTPLGMAARYGDLDMVRMMILEGLDYNAQDSSGYTPLMCAATRPDRYEVLKEFLNLEHININKIGVDGKTAYDIGNNTVKKLITDHINKRKLLRFTQTGLPKEIHEEIGKFLFGRRKYSRH